MSKIVESLPVAVTAIWANKTARRLYGVAAIVLATIWISHLVEAATEPPEVEWPKWTMRDLPIQLAAWHGEDTKLDPLIAAATGAQVIVNRLYQDEGGHAVRLHTAMFADPATGVYHSPLNCYRSAGWELVGETTENLEITPNLSIPVRLTTWKKDEEKILVMFWYELGGHTLYDRADLGIKVRWEMRGQPKWPVLVKVMVQGPLIDPDDSKAVLDGFAQKVAKWLNQPGHRKYLDRWPGA